MTAKINAKYVHTNLIAKDWKLLAKFYQDIFGCEILPPERNYKGETLDSGTGLKNTHLTGVHLKLPGYDLSGPTLEIFSYEPMGKKSGYKVNDLGFGHIAFQVEDVENARKIILQSGGKAVGEIVELKTSNGSTVVWCYVTDPEGNVIELQKWSK